jgi:hypothetical protein
MFSSQESYCNNFSSTRSSKTWLFQPTWLTQITNWHKVNNLVMNFCRRNIMNDLWINFHEWDQILNNIFHGWFLFCIEISWNFIHESATVVSTKNSWMTFYDVHSWHVNESLWMLKVKMNICGWRKILSDILCMNSFHFEIAWSFLWLFHQTMKRRHSL